MKILHCSDIHLGRRPAGSPSSVYSTKRYEDYFSTFENVVDTAIYEHVDLFLICGDLFDRRDINPDVLARTQSILGRLKNNGILTVAIEGNHDKCFNMNESWLKFLENNGFVRFLSPDHDGMNYLFPSLEVDGLRVFGLGYPGFLSDELLTELGKTLVGRDNIIMIHTAPGNSNLIPGLCSLEGIESLREKVIYIAGGHLHSRNAFPSVDPFFYVPGSLEYWDIWESGEKGFIVFDTQGEIRFHESRKRHKQELSYRIPKDSGEDYILDLLMKESIVDDSIVLLTISIEGEEVLFPEKIEKTVEEMGALKCFVRLKRESEKLSLEDFRSMSAREIECEVIMNSKEWKELGIEGKKLLSLIDMLKLYQEENQYEDFCDSLDRFLENVIGESQ